MALHSETFAYTSCGTHNSWESLIDCRQSTHAPSALAVAAEASSESAAITEARRSLVISGSFRRCSVVLLTPIISASPLIAVRRSASFGVPPRTFIDIEVCWLGADVREVHARLAIESHRLAQLRRVELRDLGRRLAGDSMAAEDTQRPGHRPGPPTRETGTPTLAHAGLPPIPRIVRSVGLILA